MAKFLVHNRRVYLSGDTAHLGPSIPLGAFYSGQRPAPVTSPPQPKPRLLTMAEAAVKQGLLGCCGYAPGDCHCAPSIDQGRLRTHASAPPPVPQAPVGLLCCKACGYVACRCGAPSMHTYEEQRAQAAKDAIARREW